MSLSYRHVLSAIDKQVIVSPELVSSLSSKFSWKLVQGNLSLFFVWAKLTVYFHYGYINSFAFLCVIVPWILIIINNCNYLIPFWALMVVANDRCTGRSIDPAACLPGSSMPGSRSTIFNKCQILRYYYCCSRAPSHLLDCYIIASLFGHFPNRTDRVRFSDTMTVIQDPIFAIYGHDLDYIFVSCTNGKKLHSLGD